MDFLVYKDVKDYLKKSGLSLEASLSAVELELKRLKKERTK